ncbi:MarR family winged helix-turn-helix transcriptional regulator [Enterococcus casseliflavus]|uniref:MarR family winged helix-turn-helix transcriptional regulator n=1 Tax=Enterococcus casseliflavus TaxID=37734 RepID=UPI000763FA20|nr:MarR family transcriptional regulator [Enterococcus casseliflavus]OJG32898.1 MarR family transcriptional regulator [Enterococcus casseliflavus]QQU23625.1 MarR family transcriptional regulator [Enterococcus casseliflavus]STQ29496.1 MarR family transcriptional regulator [Enterococcus casseliflavus]
MAHQEEALKAYIGLLRTASRLEQVAKKDVRCYGLNITEFSVLELLYHKGTHTTQAIKEKILIASSSTTYVVDQLVKKGCVQREPSQEDQRVIYVSITEAGRALMEKIFPSHAQKIAASFSELSSEELQQLKTILRKITYDQK